MMKLHAEHQAIDLLSKSLRGLVFLIALGYIGVYLALAYYRLPYPFTLEWQEGMSLEQIRRILAGQTLYVAPSLEFIPYNYPPLYFYLAALAAKLLGDGFLPLRLVSFLASLVCFGLIFGFVKRETHNWYAGIIATGLFAATYHVSGAWFDLARIDSLFLFLFLLAVYLLRFYPSKLAAIGAGLFITLAFLTKQTAFVMALPFSAYCLWRNWRRGLTLAGTTLAGIVGSTLWLDWLHDGWYGYYLFGLLQNRQPVIKSMLISFWSKDLLAPLGIACCLSILYLLVRFATSQKDGYFYLAALAGMVGGAWLARFKAAGYLNNLMPACAIIAILFGLALATIFEYLQKFLAKPPALIRIYVYMICLLQFVVLLYPPLKQLPPRQDLAAGRQLVAELRQIPGDVYCPRHGYLWAFAGKRSFAQEMAILDVLAGDRGTLKVTLAQEIRQALAAKKFAAIMDDGDWFFSAEIANSYQKQRRVFADEQVFWPVAGFRTRPENVYLPKEAN